VDDIGPIEQKLGEISPVLTGNAGDQRPLWGMADAHDAKFFCADSGRAARAIVAFAKAPHHHRRNSSSAVPTSRGCRTKDGRRDQLRGKIDGGAGFLQTRLLARSI